MQDDELDYTLGSIFNKILISRGAPKKKYSIKVPTTKIVRQEESTHLLLKQQDVLSLLNASARDIRNYKNWSDLRPVEIIQITEEDVDYKRLRALLLKDITESIRIGLIWSAFISEFVFTYKALGKKDLIRRIKRGWETNVKRINRFMLHLDKIYEYRLLGKTWPQIRQTLMRRKIIKKMTWQALQKKFIKAWEARWAKVNQEAPPIP